MTCPVILAISAITKQNIIILLRQLNIEPNDSLPASLTKHGYRLVADTVDWKDIIFEVSMMCVVVNLI